MHTFIIFTSLFTLSLGAFPDASLRRDFHRSNIYPHGRIVGGVKTDISKIPYQLALEFNGRQFCGAAILTPTIAITAAHCINRRGPNGMAIRTGSSQRQVGGSVHKVSKFLTSPKYNWDTNDYDIGLIFLSSPITYSAFSQPIQIVDSEPASGKLLISGWGDLKENANSGSETLMSVEVGITSKATCEKSYSLLLKITTRMICAGSSGKDSCQGDSGGPAVLNGKLAGVVSFGMGCARPNYPGVYTNLGYPEIRQWIRKNANV